MTHKELNYYIQEALKECKLHAECNYRAESNKLLIVGYTGTGKTTLANKLGELTGIQVIHLDEYLKPIKKAYDQQTYEKLCIEEIQDILQKPGSLILEGVQIFRVPIAAAYHKTVLLDTPRWEGAKRHAKSSTRKQKNKLHAFVLALYRSYIKWGKQAKTNIWFSMYD